MVTCRIVETRLATHIEMYIASDHRYPSDNLIRLFTVTFDWHVVGQLGYAFLSKKAGEQDVCIRQIKLAYPHVRELGANFKSATVLIVQDSSEHGRGIEIRVAQKIDGAVHAHQRDGLHVSDNAVIFNWFKGHEIRYDCVIEADQAVALALSRKLQRHKG